MKRFIQGLLIVFLVVGILPSGGAAADLAVLEGITFDNPAGKERVRIVISKPASFTVEERSGNTVRIRLEGASLPDRLKRPFGEGELANITRIVADGQGQGDRGRVAVDISLKERVPFIVKQSNRSILVDFNIASLAARKPAAAVSVPLASDKGLVLGKASGETKPAQNAKPAAPEAVGQEIILKGLFRECAGPNLFHVVQGTIPVLGIELNIHDWVIQAI